MTEPSARRVPWYWPGVADVLFLVLVLGIVQRSRDSMLDDPGLGWHLRNVDVLIESRGWPRTDPFSGPRGGARYFFNQWLGDVAFWLGERWGGLEGIAAVTTLVLAWTLRILFGMLLADGVPWPLAAVWTFLAALATSISWVARPNLFTILLVMLVVRLADRFHRGEISGRRLLILAPLFALWANVHGGFLAGLLLLAGATAIELALTILDDNAANRAAACRRAGWFALTLSACVAATAINPYGFQIYPWILGLLGDPFFMNLNTEWHSPDFHAKGAFRQELVILLFPAIVGLTQRRPGWMALGLAVFTLHLALDGRRYIPLFVVSAIPLMARASVDLPLVWSWLGRWVPSGRALVAHPPTSRIAASVAISIGLLIWSRAADGFARHNPEFIPAAALDRLLEIHEGRKVFHDYNWGGYLTWHGWPAFRVWIDDRNEVQGKDHIRDYLAVVHTEPGWEGSLAEWSIDLVAIHPRTVLGFRLAESPDWSEVHRDDHAVIFKRKT